MENISSKKNNYLRSFVIVYLSQYCFAILQQHRTRHLEQNMGNSNSKFNNSKKKNNKDDKKEKNLGSEVTEAWKEFIKDPEKAKKEINDIVAGVGKKDNSDKNLTLCYIGGAGAVTVIGVLLGILAYKALRHFV